MTATVDNFFDNAVRSGAPSAKLSNIGDWVRGEIVDQFTVDRIDFATKKPIPDRDNPGQNQQQLVIVLQTELSGWANVAKVPTQDPSNPQSPAKDPSEDDGKRAVYVAMFTNIHAAVGRAVIEGTGSKGPVRNGGNLGIKVINLENTGKGNPKKVHAAVYTPPAAGANFFDEAPAQSAPTTSPVTQQPAATQQSAPAAQQQDPWAPSPAASAPAANDPWSGPSTPPAAAGGTTTQVEEPPF